jgi:hypothetical protein
LVRVSRPARHAVWQEIAGFVRLSNPERGTGGALALTTRGLGDDGVVLIRAHKRHVDGPVTAAGASSGIIESAVQLDRALLILTRPNPDPALELATRMSGAATEGELEVRGGEPGVFYEFRSDLVGPALGLPAYVHRKDDEHEILNKGIGGHEDPGGGLRLGVDFVVARDDPASLRGTAELPPPPSLDVGRLTAGAVLHVVAVKARTTVRIPVTKTAVIDSVPELLAEPASVAPGAPVIIRVVASAVGESYQLLRDGEPVGAARDGTGTDLELGVDAVHETTTFEVAVTRAAAQTIRVERLVRVGVSVEPPG